MKHVLFVLLLTLILGDAALAQDKPAYQLFSANGKKVKYDKMVDQLAEADVIFIGEHHNNPIIHWLQLEITRDLGDSRQLILGAEMFEADNQEALNQYLQGLTDQSGLDSTARLWKNYKTDYAPLVDYAKENQLPFIATNIPRRYASLIYRQGFAALDDLSEEEKAWIAPLPIHYDADLPEYQKMLEMMGDHSSPTMPMAQASKDATMAWFISKNLSDQGLFIHYNGSYHSDNHGSILYYLNRITPGLKILTISTVEQADIGSLIKENEGLADYLVCVDEDMTKTY
jgi:uncharacterized iron-regulated protein